MLSHYLAMILNFPVVDLVLLNSFAVEQDLFAIVDIPGTDLDFALRRAILPKLVSLDCSDLHAKLFH
jgi:hypothetical protein